MNASYEIRILLLWLVYAAAATALHLASIRSGLVLLCGGMGLAVGAYAAPVIAILHPPSWLEVVVVAAGGGVAISLLALPIVRLPRDAEAGLASIACQLASGAVLLNVDWVPGGPNGVVVPLLWGQTQRPFACVAIAAFAVAVIVTSLAVAHSRLGRAADAGRQSRRYLQLLGYDLRNVRSVLWMIGCVGLAVAGMLMGQLNGFVEPEAFGLDASVSLVCAALIGDRLGPTGCLAGALFVVLMPELLRATGLSSAVGAHLRQMMIGGCLVAIALMDRSQGGPCTPS